MSFPSTLYASCKVPIRSSKLGENELFRYINCEEANDSESESESEKEMEEMEGARQFSAMALRRPRAGFPSEFLGACRALSARAGGDGPTVAVSTKRRIGGLVPWVCIFVVHEYARAL